MDANKQEDSSLCLLGVIAILFVKAKRLLYSDFDSLPTFSLVFLLYANA